MDQELIMKVQQAHQQNKEIEEKLQVINQQIEELQRFEISLSDMSNNKEKEFLASLGKGVFIKSDMKDDKLFVEVGGGILVRKSVSEAREVVAQQITRLGGLRSQLIAESESLSEQARELIEKFEKSQK